MIKLDYLKLGQLPSLLFFENHPLWLEEDAGYRSKKTDPDPDFKNVKKLDKAVNNFSPFKN